MKPVCRTTVALGAASLIGLGSLSGTGVAALAPASAHAEESAAACSASDFDLITKGHQDMALSGDSGDLSFTVKDDDKGIKHDSGTFAIEVSDELKQPLSELGDSSLPEEGWVLPQTQNPTAPWLGFNTQELSQDLLATDDTATLSMAIAQGPEDGRIVAYQAELGEPTVLMDTEDGSAWDYPGNSHSHPAFAFTKPGTYAVSFTFELPDGSRHHLHAGFLVGKQAEAKDLCDVDYSEADAATGSGNGADSRPKQLEKDIKDVDKSIAGLDKELEKTLQEGQKFLDGGAPDDAEKDKHSTNKKPANTEKSGAPQKSHARHQPDPLPLRKSPVLVHKLRPTTRLAVSTNLPPPQNQARARHLARTAPLPPAVLPARLRRSPPVRRAQNPRPVRKQSPPTPAVHSMFQMQPAQRIRTARMC